MRYYWLTSAILGLSFIQCTTTEDKPPKYPDGTSFCAGMADVECNASVLSACGASDKTKCQTNRQSACISAYVTPALSSGLVYDSKQAENCVNKVSDAYSDAKILSSEQAAIDAACGAVFSGTGAKDSMCATDIDCQQGKGLHCVIHMADQTAGDAGELMGTCQVPVSVNGGDLCDAPEDQCVEHYHCATTSSCLRNIASGLPCSNVDPCDTGLLCSGGKCIAKSPAGTACTVAAECADGMCVPVTGSPNICAAAETLALSEPFCVAIRQ